MECCKVHWLKYCIMYSFEVIVLVFCYFKILLRQKCYTFCFSFDTETFCNLTVPFTFPLSSFKVKNKTTPPQTFPFDEWWNILSKCVLNTSFKSYDVVVRNRLKPRMAVVNIR